jgi:lipopolysaccharide exporter
MHDNEMTAGQVNSSIAKGALWMLTLRFSVKGIALISTMILARLLMPEDFGLIALAMSVYSLLELIRAFGFGTALIQKQSATRLHYDTAWTLQFIFSSAAAVLLALVAYPVSQFYDEPRLLHILMILAMSMWLSGMANIGAVDFQKKMQFHREFVFGLSVKLVGFFVTIPLAFYLRSYWALLAGMFVSTLASVILSYLMHPYRPRFSLRATGELMGFSFWLLLNNFLTFASQHSQNFVLGKLGGSGAVGLLSVSTEISSLTTAEIVAPINRAAYPGYAKLATDKPLLREAYLKVLGSIVLIAVPSALGIAAIAPVFVPVLLGEKWQAAIPVIQLIAISNVFAAMSTNSGYVYLAMARQRISTLLISIRLIVFLPLLIHFSSQEGVIGAAKALFITQIVLFPVLQAVLRHILGVRWRDLARLMVRPALAGLVMLGAVSLLVSSLTRQQLDMQGLAMLGSAIFLGFALFSVVLLLLWWLAGKPEGPEKYLIDAWLRRFIRL